MITTMSERFFQMFSDRNDGFAETAVSCGSSILFSFKAGPGTWSGAYDEGVVFVDGSALVRNNSEENWEQFSSDVESTTLEQVVKELNAVRPDLVEFNERKEKTRTAQIERMLSLDPTIKWDVNDWRLLQEEMQKPGETDIGWTARYECQAELQGVKLPEDRREEVLIAWNQIQEKHNKGGYGPIPDPIY